MKHFAQRFGITVDQVKSLNRLVDVAADAQEVEHNTGKDAGPACDVADVFARLIGVTLDWSPGLYPLVVKGELSEHLPEGTPTI